VVAWGLGSGATAADAATAEAYNGPLLLLLLLQSLLMLLHLDPPLLLTTNPTHLQQPS